MTVYATPEEWALALSAGVRAQVPGRILRLQRTLALLTLGAAVGTGSGFQRLTGVVLLTPVEEGRARASWNVAVGLPDTSVPGPGAYAVDAGRIAEGARAKLTSLGAYDTVWITSSLVYMPLLEYGGYPNPPKRGTWDPRQRRWVVRSAGGFSKQAPHGMVRVTFAGVRAALAAGQIGTLERIA